jgi:hypothetical protein
MSNGTQCKLTPTPLDPVFNFKASGTGDVTLEVEPTDKNTISIDQAATKYSGGPVTFPSLTQVKFTVVAGQSTLTLVCIFSAPDADGVLNEVCAGNGFLDFLHAEIPGEVYAITT